MLFIVDLDLEEDLDRFEPAEDVADVVVIVVTEEVDEREEEAEGRRGFGFLLSNSAGFTNHRTSFDHSSSVYDRAKRLLLSEFEPRRDNEDVDGSVGFSD